MKLIFLSYSFILVIVTTCLIYLDIEGSTIYNIMLVSYLMQASLFISTIRRESEGKTQYLRPVFILLLGLTIVNFQVIIDTIYGAFRTEITIWRFQEYVGKFLYLGIIAQTSLSIGYVCKRKNNTIREKEECPSEFDFPQYLWGGILIALFVLFILTIDVRAFLTGDSSVNDGSFDRKVGTLALYSELILNAIFVIIISVTANSYSNEEDKSVKGFLSSFPTIFWIIFSVYIFLRLLSGDRGPVIYNITTLLFAYIYATKRVFSIASLSILLVVAALAVTVIGIARKKTSTLSFEAKIAYAVEELKKSDTQSFVPITQELANSVKVTGIAIRGLDRGTIEQGYGRYNLTALTNAIPFSARLLYALFPAMREKSFVSSEVLTVEGYGKNYSSGLGNTAIADVYLDFRTLGIPIMFFIFGLIYRKVDEVIVEERNVSPYLLTFVLFLSSHAIYIGRSSFSFIVANACLYVLIQYVLNFLIKFTNIKR